MAGLPTEGFAEQLNRLRVRAGNPSVRELAKLTERQGARRAMSRSTVQDKISGKSLPRMGQILALVQACADYADSIGVPLPPEDTDEQVWRERAQTAWVRTAPATLPLPAPGAATAGRSQIWDLDPFIRSGMYDIVMLVQDNEDCPMAEWLPQVINALEVAGMSIVQFLKVASKQAPKDFVETVLSMAVCGEKVVERLMFFGAAYQPVDAIPTIIVSLRRSGAPEGAELASLLIDLIAGGSNRGFPTMRNDCAPIVLALRAATLERDAARLLYGIGSRRVASSLLEIAAAFPDKVYGDRETILNSVAKGTAYHLGHVFMELKHKHYDGIDPETTLDRIIFGIPDEERERILSYLELEGFQDEARRVRELRDEPPF